ncbi:MAG: hypothetical protein LBB51_06245 [Zoogloeaceae bacterium]|nr:hypothetical protein [Zoogloeaceae bacterium]
MENVDLRLADAHAATLTAAHMQDCLLEGLRQTDEARLRAERF